MDWQTITTVWGFNYAFWVATIIALGSVYLAWRMRSVSRLAYHLSHSNIVGEEQTAFSQDLVVTYKGKEIERATLTRLSVWNDGNQTIRRDDITNKKPLGIAVPGGMFLLHMKVASMADEAMEVRFEDGDEASFNVTFEYIEPGSGFVCDILHTGKPDNFKFFGTVIRAKEPVSKYLPLPPISGQLKFSLALMIVAVPLGSIEMIGLMQSPEIGRIAYISGLMILLGSVLAPLWVAYFLIKAQFKVVSFGTDTPSDAS